MTLLLDLADDGSATRGEPYLQSRDGARIFCPKCLTEIEGGPGYGLAFGGMGTYWACEADGCDWFYKIMDREETE